MTGMVFPFQGDIQEIKTMIYTWMQHEVEIIESYTTIRIELIHDNFVIIDNIDIFIQHIITLSYGKNSLLICLLTIGLFSSNVSTVVIVIVI